MTGSASLLFSPATYSALRAHSCSGVVTIKEAATECGDCPLLKRDRCDTVMVTRLEHADDEGLRRALGVDFRKVEPVYTGRKLPKTK